jgi:hypothetical protein
MSIHKSHTFHLNSNDLQNLEELFFLRMRIVRNTCTWNATTGFVMEGNIFAFGIFLLSIRSGRHLPTRCHNYTVTMGSVAMGSFPSQWAFVRHNGHGTDDTIDIFRFVYFRHLCKRRHVPSRRGFKTRTCPTSASPSRQEIPIMTPDET